MNSHLILSLKPTWYTPFLSQYISGRLYLELWEKFNYQDIIAGILSKQDKLHMELPRLIKKVIVKIMFQGGGREKYIHFEIGEHVQMAKNDPEAQIKSSLSDCTCLEKWAWILILKLLEIPNASRESGSLLYYRNIFFLLFSPFFYSPLWTLDHINTYLPPCLDNCSSPSEEVMEFLR